MRLFQRMMAAVLLAGVTCLGIVAAEDSTRGELEKLWTVLGVKDPAAAEQALADLAARRARTVSFLRERLRPVPVLNPRQVVRWLGELDSDQFTVREKATQELEKLAEVVESPLRKALSTSPSLEARRRIKALLERIKAERLNPSPDRLRAVRAIEVLERVNDSEARQLLAILARGAPEAQLTTEAKTALERLGEPAPSGSSR